MGPFYVRVNSEKVKVWILCVTCLWTRAINLRISHDLSTTESLRSLQMHTFEYGVPMLILSDLGSQIVTGVDVVGNLLSDPEALSYFRENGESCISFQQYYKGCNKLGSLVESCVKLTKRLLSGAIKNNVLDLREFEFFCTAN